MSSQETIIVQIPSSIRPFIIGTKGSLSHSYPQTGTGQCLKRNSPSGRNLKAITDATGTSITFPKREGEEGAPAPAAEEPVASDENADDPLVPVTIAGDSASVQEAKARIMAVVNERTSKISQKISAIPREFYPLLNGVKGKKMAELVKVTLRGDAPDPTEHGAVDDLSVFVPSHFVDRNRGIAANGVGHEDEESGAGGDPKAAQKGKERDGSIVVSGDREAVAKVVEAIENSYDELVSLNRVSPAIQWTWLICLLAFRLRGTETFDPNPLHQHPQTTAPIPRRPERRRHTGGNRLRGRVGACR